VKRVCSWRRKQQYFLPELSADDRGRVLQLPNVSNKNFGVSDKSRRISANVSNTGTSEFQKKILENFSFRKLGKTKIFRGVKKVEKQNRMDHFHSGACSLRRFVNKTGGKLKRRKKRLDSGKAHHTAKAIPLVAAT
jgi:hypothetical protein